MKTVDFNKIKSIEFSLMSFSVGIISVNPSPNFRNGS